MLGRQNWNEWSFLDGIGRIWTWKFVPKDMPFSEWSIYNSALQRLRSLNKVFGDRVTVRRDLSMVMGVDEQDLEKYAMGVTYTIRTKPWRQEVDIWRSFVNVDYAFLEKLDDKWLNKTRRRLGYANRETVMLCGFFSQFP